MKVTEGILNEKRNTLSTDIFFSTLNKDENWSDPKPFDRNLNTFYFEASPTFTEDGNTMYFISERIGGKGKADIWTSKKVNGTWQKAENLGDKINTAEKETTDFVTADGNYLFFSSEGHSGMGGYDIYVAKRTADGWSTPKNIGFPINDVSDETHFVFYPKLKKAYQQYMEIKECYYMKRLNAQHHLQRWIKRAKKSKIPTMKTAAKTIENSIGGLLNYLYNRESNAAVENFNRKLKTFLSTVKGVNNKNIFFFRLIQIYA